MNKAFLRKRGTLIATGSQPNEHIKPRSQVLGFIIFCVRELARLLSRE